jgi:hypothetical protein
MGFPTAADVVSNPGELANLFGLNPATIGDLAVDLAISYTDPSTAEVTERAVESGMPITDARQILPQRLTMDCIFTDPDVSGGNIARQALSGTLSQALTTSWRDKRDRLREIFDNQEVISVSTYEDDFHEMVIISITPDRRASTANAYFCRVEFREIKIVSSEFSLIDAAQIPKEAAEQESTAAGGQKEQREKRSPGTQNKGKNQTNTATEQESTWAYDLVIG